MALSFLFPGMGDLYLGHRGFAALELTVAACFWLALLALALDPSLGPGAFYLTAGLVVLFMHGADAIATRHIARGGLYPARPRERPLIRYPIAAALPALVLAGTAATVSARRGLAPAPTLLAGHELPARQVDALRHAGYLAPDETVVRFYSAGIGTILEDGNIQTDRRLVSYAQEAGGAFFDAMSYDSIVDLALEPWPGTPDLRALRVIGGDGRWFVLFVPAAGGQDTTFLRGVEAVWRAGRRAVPGIWFDGGAGERPEDPVVIRGLTSPDDIEAAEQWWLELWIDVDEAPWEIRRRLRHRLRDLDVDEVAVRTASGAEQVVYFDVTGAR
jgi:hypothetical protein